MYIKEKVHQILRMSFEKEKDEPQEFTKSVGNEMFFCGEITPESTLEFTEKFKRMEIELLKRSADLVDYDPKVNVYIMSEGGDMFSGFALMNLLQKSRIKVTTIVQGACCSAATFMFLGGSQRRIGANAYVLIHQINTEIWGKYQELKNEIKNCDNFMKMINGIYLKYTNIPEKKLHKILKKDLFLDKDKCIKYGIAHVVD